MPMTVEQKKAASERMKAMHAKKKAEKAAAVAAPEEPVTRPGEEQPVEQPQINIPAATNDDIAELLRRIKELEDRQFIPQIQPGFQPQMSVQGMVGTFTKYDINPINYPDETDRLAAEPKLQRFAFDHNYELRYSVGVSSYDTKNNVHVEEPKFTLQLIRIVMDEETGEPTNRRFVVCQMIFHEDPATAVIVAREHGLDVDEVNQRAFLNEMRFMRMRDWLIECFYPQKPIFNGNKKQTVIGNRLVEVYEVNSEQSQSIPFNTMSKKL